MKEKSGEDRFYILTNTVFFQELLEQDEIANEVEKRFKKKQAPTKSAPAQTQPKQTPKGPQQPTKGVQPTAKQPATSTKASATQAPPLTQDEELEKQKIRSQVEMEFLKKSQLDDLYEEIKQLKMPNSGEFYEKSIARLVQKRKLKEDGGKLQQTLIQECLRTVQDQPNSYVPYENLLLLQEEDNSGKMKQRIIGSMLIN